MATSLEGRDSGISDLLARRLRCGSIEGMGARSKEREPGSASLGIGESYGAATELWPRGRVGDDATLTG